MKKYQLGEFEEVVLLIIGVLFKDAYGVSIKKAIEERLSRSVSMGALHTALVRLEDKGYIKSAEGEKTEERAGRPKNISRSPTLVKRRWNTTATPVMNYGMRSLKQHLG